MALLTARGARGWWINASKKECCSATRSALVAHDLAASHLAPPTISCSHILIKLTVHPSSTDPFILNVVQRCVGLLGSAAWSTVRVSPSAGRT